MTTAVAKKAPVTKKSKYRAVDDIPVEWVLTFARHMCRNTSTDCIMLAAYAAASELGIDTEEMNAIVVKAILEHRSHGLDAIPGVMP